MMRPRVATVLSARPWESDFVTAARATAAVRVVARAYEPGEVGPDVDVIVVGSDVAWVTPSLLRRWCDAGIRVIGVHPQGDLPGKAILEAGEAHEIRSDDVSSIELVAAARLLGLSGGGTRSTGRIGVVTGPDGAPGRTEMAILHAFSRSRAERTVIVDLDRRAPSLSLRLGLPPRPDLADGLDELRNEGTITPAILREIDGLSVVTGTFGRPPVDATTARDIVWALSRDFDRVVVDGGPWAIDDPLVPIADEVILVCDATPTGLVRAAGVVIHWTGAQPSLVLNRMVGDPQETLMAARRATGLEPSLQIPYDEDIRLSAARCQIPPASTWRWMSGLAA
ncbi:MAG: hypothetical protein OEO77_09775 [Acidimicrobiia bacterium]|nr:hypothetical protein [Acidimicrobiia bacterium]